MGLDSGFDNRHDSEALQRENDFAMKENYWKLRRIITKRHSELEKLRDTIFDWTKRQIAGKIDDVLKKMEEWVIDDE